VTGGVVRSAAVPVNGFEDNLIDENQVRVVKDCNRAECLPGMIV